VVVEEIAVRDLIEHMLPVTGKDQPRICEILLRGSLVSGASRLRWQGWQAEPDAIHEILATFPDPDPSRVFTVRSCTRAVLRGSRQPIEIPREAVSRRGLFQRQTFWDLLMELVAGGAATYADYSYRDRADRFIREFTLAEAGRLRSGAAAVSYSTLRDQIRSAAFTGAELYVRR
jgi:hypothetical protein